MPQAPRVRWPHALCSRCIAALRRLVRFRWRPFWLRRRLGWACWGAGCEAKVGPQLSLGRGVRVYLLPGGQLELGARVRLQERVLIVVHPGATLHIGEGTYVGPGCELHAMEAVEVGADCLLAGEVILIDHDHVFDLASPVREKEHTTGAVSVGDGCWLGTRAVLTRGSQVGRHCVVGAGAVVTGPIPDGSIATGIPAREKGTR